MEKAPDNKGIPERLIPPDESNMSMILNGAGNGMMLGALPFLLAEMAEGITKQSKHRFEMSPRMHLLGAGATIVGAVLGALYGRFESNELNKYRFSIGSEISNLNAEIKHLNTEIAHLREKPKSWVSRVESGQDAPAADIAR